jgi:hypothetical protein
MAAQSVSYEQPYLTGQIRRLILGVLAQACLDAASLSKDREMVRLRAREWLLKEGADWAGIVDFPLKQREIEAWAARGWEIDRRSILNLGDKAGKDADSANRPTNPGARLRLVGGCAAPGPQPAPVQ